jgi:hypothetical protein
MYDFGYTSRPRFSVVFFRSMRNAMPLVSIAGTAEEKNNTWCVSENGTESIEVMTNIIIIKYDYIIFKESQNGLI